MKIEKIIMKNYRQYRDLELNFDSDKLYLVKGIMGTGKTNFLNAINWCLYEEEPYLSRSSQQLPLLNLKTVNEANGGEKKEVVVEIWVKTDNEKHIVFTRKAQYLLIDGKTKTPTIYKAPEFEVKTEDNDGNYEFHKDEEAEYYVERFVPKDLRDFFFFDGERLDRYFREAKGQTISHAILQISQTYLLKKTAENLQKIKSEYNKEAGKLSPNIEMYRTQLDDAERIKNDRIKFIEDCNKQIKIAEEKINEYRQKTDSIPDVEKLNEERKKLNERRKENEEALKEKLDEKKKLLFEYGKIIYLHSAIKRALDIIKDKREKKELPPTADKALIQTIFDKKFCSICSRKFSSNSEEEKSVKKLLESINLSTAAASALQSMESPLIFYHEKFMNFKDNIKKISKEIERYDGDLQGIDTKLEEIDKQCEGYNEEKVRGWYKELRNFEKILTSNNQSLGNHKVELQKATKSYDEITQLLDQEIHHEKQFGELEKKVNFVKKSIEILDKTRTEVMDKIRKKISKETEKKFFELTWKKETFEKVSISEDYEISLIHKMGYDCLGTISGGEREVLALSFTMALHTISGFDAPILIDRPLAMVSGDPREYVANILLKLADKKQLILFLTPDDYDSVSNLLNTKTCTILEVKMSKDEKETELEGV